MARFYHSGLLLTLLLCACTTNMNQATIEKNDADKVEFSIKVDPASFSKDVELKVTLYDPIALKAADDSASCSVAFDPTSGGSVNNNCPNEQKSEPETFTFKASELDKELKVSSQSVNVGEKYRIQISGKASDDCNTASAQKEGTAESSKVVVENLPIAQTELACVKN